MKISKDEIEEMAMFLLEGEEDDINDFLEGAYGIDLETYIDIVRPILEKLSIGISPLSKQVYIGVSEENFWYVKKPADQQFIPTMIQWILECGPMPKKGKGFIKDVTTDGKLSHRIAICGPDTDLTIKKDSQEQTT